MKLRLVFRIVFIIWLIFNLIMYFFYLSGVKGRDDIYNYKLIYIKAKEEGRGGRIHHYMKVQYNNNLYRFAITEKQYDSLFTKKIIKLFYNKKLDKVYSFRQVYFSLGMVKLSILLLLFTYTDSIPFVKKIINKIKSEK